MIKVENATKSFLLTKGIRNVSLEIDKGTIAGFLGPNGSGKTTLIRSIVGDYILNEGSIEIDGLPSRKSRIEHIAYMPSESKFPNYTLYKIIDIYNNFINDFNKELALEILISFKISGFLRFNKLSKGQQKAFHFSLTMARDCDYYIFDEPFSGIDPVYRKQIIDEILDHINTEDKVIIISSHELNEIDSILDKCVLLKKGEVEGVYDIDEIQAENNLYDWYIEKYSN